MVECFAAGGGRRRPLRAQPSEVEVAVTALRGFVQAAGDTLGGLDIVVANVSALAIGQDEASWNAEFQTDLMGAVRLVDAAMPFLEASDAASITFISSVSGREVDFAAGAYGAMKAALVHYAQGLAVQLAGKGIRANTVSPGNTYFAGGVWARIERDNPAFFAEALALNPTGRMGRPEEMARRRVPRQPRRELRERHEPRGRRRADPERAALRAWPQVRARPATGGRSRRGSRPSPGCPPGRRCGPWATG